MKKLLIPIVVTVAAMPLALPWAASSPQTDHNGFYCINGPNKKGTYSFALKERPDKNLAFGISLWWPDGNNFAVTGTARPSGNGWRYEDASSQDHCVVIINPEIQGYGLTINQRSCQSNGGLNAVPAKVIFTAKMRQGPAGNILDNTEVFANTECKAAPATETIPLKVQW